MTRREHDLVPRAHPQLAHGATQRSRTDDSYAEIVRVFVFHLGESRKSDRRGEEAYQRTARDQHRGKPFDYLFRHSPFANPDHLALRARAYRTFAFSPHHETAGHRVSPATLTQASFTT